MDKENVIRSGDNVGKSYAEETERIIHIIVKINI